MSEPEVIAVGTTCPICGETFYAPEPKYSELIQQLVRVARAAESVSSFLSAFTRWTPKKRQTIKEFKDALSALPEGMFDENIQP